MWILHEYQITENDGALFWHRELAEGMFMSGKCALGRDVLILHAYEDVEHFNPDISAEKWCGTAYFMVVSGSGNTGIFNVLDGEPASDKVKSEIGAQVGCTLRFRQG